MPAASASRRACPRSRPSVRQVLTAALELTSSGERLENFDTDATPHGRLSYLGRSSRHALHRTDGEAGWRASARVSCAVRVRYGEPSFGAHGDGGLQIACTHRRRRTARNCPNPRTVGHIAQQFHGPVDSIAPPTAMPSMKRRGAIWNHARARVVPLLPWSSARGQRAPTKILVALNGERQPTSPRS
jgi:hypothetical protein